MPKLIVLVGISASGKNTYANELKNNGYIIVSSDSIREEICPGDHTDQSMNDEVFRLYHQRIYNYLLSGKNVVADATNITIKSRRAILGSVVKVQCEKEAVIFNKPFEQCNIDNTDKKYPVPPTVLLKQIGKFEIPFYEEGWDKISFAYHNVPCYEYLAESMKDFDQKNPHHTMNLWEHCKHVGDLFSNYFDYDKYKGAAYYHDISKLETQTIDEKGIAHYYSHENFSSYLMCTHGCEDLNWLFLINYHMMPFHWNTDKARLKWNKIFGYEKFKMLEDFNKCDKSR